MIFFFHLFYIYCDIICSFLLILFIIFLFLCMFVSCLFGVFLLDNFQSLEDDVTVHETDVSEAGRLVDSLSALCCVSERDRLAQKLDFLHARYREVQDLCSRKSALLGQALSNARLFGEDEVEVLNWLAEVEDKLSSVSVKDYKMDVLQNQHKNQMVHLFYIHLLFSFYSSLFNLLFLIFVYHFQFLRIILHLLHDTKSLIIIVTMNHPFHVYYNLWRVWSSPI